MSGFTLTAPAVCAVCGGDDGRVTVKPLNGLPKGVVACSSCRQAVERREVGVVVRPDGTLHVTDGRKARR